MDNLGFVDDESCIYEDDSEERLLDFEEFQTVSLTVLSDTSDSTSFVTRVGTTQHQYSGKYWCR